MPRKRTGCTWSINDPTATLEKPLGLSQQLTEARKLNEQLTQDNEQINRALDKEKNDDRQTRAKLETENVRLQTADERNRTEIVKLNKEVREAVAAMDAAHKTLESLREENESLAGRYSGGPAPIATRR